MHPVLRVSALLLGLFLLGGCSAALDKETFCFDGKDDDGNGLVDCDDPACASVAGCIEGKSDGGTDNWGMQCTAQTGCLNENGYKTSPLGMCVRGDCATPEGVVLKMTIDGAAYTGVSQMRSMSTRIVSKKAIDDTTVTCDTLAAAAPSKLEADADQLATSKKFNLFAWDSINLSVVPGQSFELSRLRTNVGKDFLIWVEIWTGSRLNSLPTGTRVGWTCVDNAAEIVPNDDQDAFPPGRNISFALVAPQG